MATFKFTGGVHHFRDKMIAGMLARGYTAEFAAETFSRIEGFGSYGFPESHAASFALIAYASAWLKRHYPDVFCCALLNAQPMGFYAPAQIVRDAQAHGVAIRPVCVNASGWDCALEAADRGFAVRLGLRMTRGLARRDAEALIARRGDGYASIPDMWQRALVPRATLERLAEVDAFQALGLDRRQAGWAIKGLPETGLPLFDAPALMAEPAASLRPLPAGREVVADYRAAGLSLRDHPVAFLRHDLDVRRITRCADLAQARDGRRLAVAGIVLVRQRPGSARGVLFLTIEDETGHANVIVWPSLFERVRGVLLSARMLSCAGRVQREGAVIHVVAETVDDLSALLADVERRDAEGAVVADASQVGLRVPTRDFR
jgi:error-prone DNA polymerase